jgi:hypothetical protein
METEVHVFRSDFCERIQKFSLDDRKPRSCPAVHCRTSAIGLAWTKLVANLKPLPVVLCLC